MKKIKNFLLIISPVVLLLLLKFFIFSNSINTPDKISIYDHGILINSTINENDIKGILNLTNNRVGNFLEKCKDSIDDDELNSIKKSGKGIEFTYFTQQKLYLKYFTEVKFYKIYFQLVSDNDKDQIVLTLQYGDKDNYFDSSIGKLKYSQNLIDIINKYQ